ncbi:MAG: hypothetical protein IJT78_00230 [Oscillospiraceae bacterium]|nr:hypothetical protein [Oscillospiraceae bacterium]
MKSSFSFKLLSAVVLAAVVLYFVVEIYQYLDNPFSTTLTYESAAEDSISLTGWIVRREESFHADAATVTHSLSEGARAATGETIAVAYQSAAALDTVSRIETLELQLQQLEFAHTSYLNADAALKLDTTITGSILSARRQFASGDYSAAADELSALKAAVLKRSHTYSSAEEIQADIAAVQSELSALRATLTGAQYIAAPRSGIYSAVCDGYESVLTPDILPSVTPSSLQHITPGENTGNVGKMIYGDTWYYAAVLDEQYVEVLRPGQIVTLRLAKGLERDIDVTVESVSEPEGGQAAVVLSCAEYLPQVTTLRRQAASLVMDTYEGLRIPSSALRMDEDGVLGVYCVAGITARFKPVEVVYRGSGYTLVRPAADASDSATLRRGDEIILTATRLEDGIVVR